MKKFCLLYALSLFCLIAGDLKFEVKKLHVDNNEACAIADFNNDGVLDISAGEFWYAGPDYSKGRKLRTLKGFGKDYLHNCFEQAYDVDQDGWTDIIAISFLEVELCWYKNPGKDAINDDQLWKKNVFAKTANQNEIAYLHDFDKDGVPEFVANSWNKKNAQLIWRFDFKANPPTVKKSTLGKINGHGIGFGDINGDGREDILFGQGWYERPEGDIFNQEWTLHKDWNWHASCPMIVADLNKDGKNDIIWGNGHDYGLFWEEQLAAKNGKIQWKRHEIDKSMSQFHTMVWIDIDGDGAKELITGKRVRAHSGKDPGAKDQPAIVCYKWNPKDLKFTKQVIADGVGTGLHIRTADLDKNKKLDIVVAGKNGTYILFQK